MTKLRKPFFLSVAMMGVSIRKEMRIIVEQTESSISRSLEEMDQCQSMEEYEFDEISEDGNLFKITMYSYKGVSGYDKDDVKEEYKELIEKLSRRSAYLTIFGLFEYHLEACCRMMINMSSYGISFDDMQNGTIEKTHNLLKKEINLDGCSKIQNVDHLLKIRNVMAHNNGSTRYKSSKNIDRVIRRISRAGGGLSVDGLGLIRVDKCFLPYAVSEFDRYHRHMESAIQSYYLKNFL